MLKSILVLASLSLLLAGCSLSAQPNIDNVNTVNTTNDVLDQTSGDWPPAFSAQAGDTILQLLKGSYTYRGTTADMISPAEMIKSAAFSFQPISSSLITITTPVDITDVTAGLLDETATPLKCAMPVKQIDARTFTVDLCTSDTGKYFVSVSATLSDPNDSGNISAFIPVSVAFSQAATVGGLTYTNSTYGFSLTLPADWAGFTTSERTLDWGDLGTSPSIDFALPGSGSLFNISIHTAQQWQQLQDQGGPSPTYLGANAQYTFGYDQAQDVVPQYTSQFDEIPAIGATFKLN